MILHIWQAQIHHNTNIADIAKQFNKYVDDVFNNVLNDSQVFQKIKQKAYQKLNQKFNNINTQTQPKISVINVTIMNNNITDDKTVASVAYRNISTLFAAHNTHSTKHIHNKKILPNIGPPPGRKSIGDKPIIRTHIIQPIPSQVQQFSMNMNMNMNMNDGSLLPSNSNSPNGSFEDAILDMHLYTMHLYLYLLYVFFFIFQFQILV